MTARAHAAERPLDLALAALHLRTGSLGLARAELEAMAGAGVLDRDGLAELAEARWRTGDLAGAGEAADAYLARGGESLVALVIAAEATAAIGRADDARSLVDRAVERSAGRFDEIFAGMPRSPIWPADREGDAAPTGGPPDDTPSAEQEVPAAVASDADLALESARASLDAGDLAAAAVQLAVAVRLAPLLAPTVLEIAAAHQSPGLDLVRGDALLALGRETEARRAWADAAAGAGD